MKSQLSITKADKSDLPFDQLRYEWKDASGTWHGVIAGIHGEEDPLYIAQFLRHFAHAIEQKARSQK